jgi:sarcosine oxidase delta subunit
MGVLREWWYHRAGCGRWFIAERHTKTHEINATYLWSET